MDSVLFKLKELGTEEANTNLELSICLVRYPNHFFNNGMVSHFSFTQLSALLIRNATNIEKQKATLMTLHDEIAGYKAEYDADQELNEETLAINKSF